MPNCSGDLRPACCFLLKIVLGQAFLLFYSSVLATSFSFQYTRAIAFRIALCAELHINASSLFPACGREGCRAQRWQGESTGVAGIGCNVRRVYSPRVRCAARPSLRLRRKEGSCILNFKRDFPVSIHHLFAAVLIFSVYLLIPAYYYLK